MLLAVRGAWIAVICGLAVTSSANAQGGVPVVGNSGYRTGVDLELPGTTSGFVDVSSGNLVLSFVDLRYSDRDTEFGVGRTYNSLAVATQDLGPAWRLNTGYELALNVSDPAAPVFTGATGATERFTRQADGSFVADGAFDAQLQKTTAGYELRLGLDGNTYEFDNAGQIKRIVDPLGDRAGDGPDGVVFETTSAAGMTRFAGQRVERVGQQTYFSYDGTAKVIQVTDTQSRHLNYGYTNGRLSSRTLTGLPSQTYEYNAAGRLATVNEGGQALLQVSYDAQGRVAQTTAARGTGTFVTTFEYGSDGTTVRGSDGSVRFFEIGTDGVVSEDRVGPNAPPVTLGGTLIARLPQPVVSSQTYTVSVGAATNGDAIRDIEVSIDGDEVEYFTPTPDANGNVTQSFEFVGDEYGASTLIVEIAVRTVNGSTTTKRLIVRVPDGDPEPHPFADDPFPSPSARASNSGSTGPAWDADPSHATDLRKALDLPSSPDAKRAAETSSAAEQGRSLIGIPLTSAELSAVSDRLDNRELHEPVLQYAQKQPDFAGAWSREGVAAEPVVAFTGDLDRHRRAIAALPQAPGLQIVKRRHARATLVHAARRALTAKLESGAVVGTSVDDKANRPLIRVSGVPTKRDRRKLAKLVGYNPRIVKGGAPERRSRAAPESRVRAGLRIFTEDLDRGCRPSGPVKRACRRDSPDAPAGCTANVAARGVGARKSTNYLLTSGHCSEKDAVWSNGRRIGPMVRNRWASISGGSSADAAAIRMSERRRSRSYYRTVITSVGVSSEVQLTFKVGDVLCASLGFSNVTRCTAVVDPSYDAPPGYTPYGSRQTLDQVIMSGSGIGGDSGSPLWRPLKPLGGDPEPLNAPRGRPAGILSATADYESDGTTYRETIHSKMQNVEEALDVRVLGGG